MKVLILGGGGFVGSAVVDRLVSEGHALRILERPGVAPHRSFRDDEEVEWLAGDALEASEITVAMEGVDAVVDLIWTTLPRSSNDDPIFDVQSNIVGALNILNAMRKQGVPRIIFISSGGTVYGRPTYLPIDERHPTDPLVSYGITKLAIEKYLLMYESLYGIRAVILRVSNPFGERQRIETAQGAIGVFLDRALRGAEIEIWGDGTVTRDYLYIGDVADAFSKALRYTGSCSVFNVGSGTGTSLLQILAALEEVLGCPIRRKHLPGRPFDVPVNVLDNRLAGRELGWAPAVPLRDGLVKTAAWMKQQLANAAGPVLPGRP